MSRRRVPRAVLVLGGVAVGLALGGAIDIARSGGLETWLAQRGLGAPYDARGQTVDIEGRAVYLDCRGTGSPTVILESGFGSGAGGWGFTFDGVATFTRVCAWDRPGIGHSEPRGRHSGADVAADLRAALEAAAEPGPFVVVGHSLGGVYGRLFAASGPTPDEPSARQGAVLGLVMVDTFEPDLGLDLDPALDEATREEFARNIAGTGAMIQEGEDLDWAATMAQLEAYGAVRLPTHLLMVDPALRFTDPDPARRTALIDAWRRGIAARYPNGTLEIVPNTGHLIQLERPSLVIDRVREMVLRLRAASA